MGQSLPENYISGDISSAAEALIRAHDGDCALLYLWYRLRNSTDSEKAAGELCMTVRQVEDAGEKLRRMGLVSSCDERHTGSAAAEYHQDVPAHTEARHPGRTVNRDPDESGKKGSPSAITPDKTAATAKTENPHEFTDEDIARAGSDKVFTALRNRLQEVMGKTISRHELVSLLDIYHRLRLPPDVIYVLLQYCSEVSQFSTGAIRPPTMNYIEKTAYSWVNNGIDNVEAAEEYVEKRKSQISALGKICKVLDIYDRKLTTNERDAAISWLEMGFEEDAIRAAYERTVDKTGKRSLPYMSTILARWHEAGIHTLSEIEEKDPIKSGNGSSRGGTNVPPGKSGRNERFDPTAIDNIVIQKMQ